MGARFVGRMQRAIRDVREPNDGACCRTMHTPSSVW